MTPGKFLRLVWPDRGLYCMAHPYNPGEVPNIHRVFPTISEAVTHAHELMHSTDVFFAVLSLEKDKVWDPEKTDYKTGQKGAYATRKQENMLAARTLFFDLDVGADAGKYPTQRDALADLVRFLQLTKLPMPTLNSSGGGVHVYWHFHETILTADWRPIAWNMRQLAEKLGLKVDPTRTTDITSVLRVPGTSNWKNRANPRPVRTLQEGTVSPIADLKRLISDAMIAHGVPQTETPALRAAPVMADHGLGTQEFNDFGPPPTLEELGAACGQVREIIRSQTQPAHPHYGPFDNTAWYRGMLATIKHVEGGDDWCRRLTALHPRTNADTDAKLLQLEQFPPARCDTLQQFMPWKDSPCQTCKFRNDPSVPNPFAACRKSTPAPPPSLTASTASSSSSTTSADGGNAQAGQSAPPPPPAASAGAPPIAPSLALQAGLIPNPPKPYERLKGGGISLTRKDKDGNDTVSIIYPHDLYPLKRLSNRVEGKEQQVWRVTLPRSGAHEFVIDSDVLYDGRKFCAAIAHNGIYPHKADIPALQDYMVAYISQLQKTMDADSQSSHLGWADEYRQFILPDKTLHADGTVRASALTDAALKSSQRISKAGDMAEQVKLLRFYEHPAYIPNQSVILDAFASIIFYATGHHGIVVNLSGDAGASKSSTAYTAASIWGDPVLWPINGTNRGATANARAQRVVTNANLPTIVDEITHLPPRDAIDLVMNITQPGHRLRLDTSGAERNAGDNYKSAIMISTANNSLHSLLSLDNAAGTAGSMRVFEMKFFAQHVHTKAEADEYMRQLRLHHGHLGEIFAQFVVKNRKAVENRVQQVVREIDVACKITSGERFWSARVACGIVAGEICRALGLTNYDVDAIRDWTITKQIPYMRGIVHEEYRDSLAILTDYIAEKNGNILVVDKATSLGANTAGQTTVGSSAFPLNNPHGALLGHYDLKAGVLYLLKQGFKDHCQSIGTSSSRIISELAEPRLDEAGQNPSKIVIDRNCRRTLGAGTQFAKGQVYCFAIDMNHREISGQVPLQSVQNTSGGPLSAPTGVLKSVS